MSIERRWCVYNCVRLSSGHCDGQSQTVPSFDHAEGPDMIKFGAP